MRVELRVRDPEHQVERARAQRRETDARLAGQRAVRVGHEGGAALVAGRHEPDRGCPPARRSRGGSPRPGDRRRTRRPRSRDRRRAAGRRCVRPERRSCRKRTHVERTVSPSGAGAHASCAGARHAHRGGRVRARPNTRPFAALRPCVGSTQASQRVPGPMRRSSSTARQRAIMSSVHAANPVVGHRTELCVAIARQARELAHREAEPREGRAERVGDDHRDRVRLAPSGHARSTARR